MPAITVTLVMCGVAPFVTVAIVMGVVVTCNASPVRFGKAVTLPALVHSAYMGSMMTRNKNSRMV